MTHRIAHIRTAAAAAALALAACGPVAPASAADLPPVPRPHANPATRSGEPAPGARPAWGLNPAPGSDCPDGSSRTTTLASTNFDGGTAGTFASAMSIQSEGTNKFARQVGTGAPVAQLLASPVLTTTPSRVYVKFSVRGDFADQDLVVTPRYGGTAWAVPSAASAGVSTSTWRTVYEDMTDGANESTLGEDFAVVFARDAASRTTVDLDNVEVYQCTPAPVGEPGDFNGDGLADAVFVMRDGNLLMAAGTLADSRTLWRGGVGWASMTWIGSTGDTNGDGYTDLLARTGAGDLLAYYGDGARSFTGSRKIGTGWQSMTAIMPVGDVDGDGNQDLIARSADGLMRLYSFTPAGGLTGGKIVGSGWQNFTSVMAIRSTAGADTATRLYAILPNGDMKSYTVSSTGAMTGWGTKVGNGWAFSKVTSVGDFDGDGHDDVLAVAADGTAYIYPTTGEGTWKSRLTLTESIWNAALLIG